MKEVAMSHRQRGITLIGFVIVLAVVGFFGYMGMVLGPSYSEYYGVVSAMEKVSKEPGAEKSDIRKIRKSLQRYFDVGYVDTVDAEQLVLIKDKSAGNSIQLVYEVRKPYLYNIDFVMKFEVTKILGTSSTRE